MVGLDDWGDAYPQTLSGGMQQRVGLARALATEARMLLMDEPFSALDPLIKVTMQQELKTLQARLGRTILFITHDLDEAMRLGIASPSWRTPPFVYLVPAMMLAMVLDRITQGLGDKAPGRAPDEHP